MSQTAESLAFFFAPFVSSTLRISPEWIDYNGHLNMAYYGVLFDQAIEEAFTMVGLGADYIRERDCSYFLVESHTIFLREIRLNDQVRITLQLIDYDEKRLHYYLEMRESREGWLAASCENLSLHVDTRRRKATPFPADILDNIAVMKSAHARLPRPETLGRAMGVPKRPNSGRPRVH
jgi:acyl-CoA thioester hydrolase